MKTTTSTLAISAARAVIAAALICNVGILSPALAQPSNQKASKQAEDDLKKTQTAAIDAYGKALSEFKAILVTRRAQINAQSPLPDLPGQAIYLARIKVISRYKDLTDVLPSRIGPPNKFGIPPDHFDVAIEPLIDEYTDLFRVLQAPPAFAQASPTPFEDVVALGRAIARAKNLDDATADVAARLSLALFFAETNGIQNIGNARSNKYKGSLQTDAAEDRRGRTKWLAIRERVAALDPLVATRDTIEEARARDIDQRYNHWTAVRNGLTNAAAELFPKIPAIVAMLPDEMDQMKFFELIQIVPAPTRSALESGNVLTYEISAPRIMGYLRNNSMFTFGKANRAKTSATFREVLDAMWLFNPKFQSALAKFNEIKLQPPVQGQP